ncbi:hypothetical protein [Baaleninema sp.]|uniref:hypothetical protein n=1 Tax=Baaleninema sp. TaxID=3101197 RepID=UPI003CFC6B01
MSDPSRDRAVERLREGLLSGATAVRFWTTCSLGFSSLDSGAIEPLTSPVAFFPCCIF